MIQLIDLISIVFKFKVMTKFCATTLQIILNFCSCFVLLPEPEWTRQVLRSKGG